MKLQITGKQVAVSEAVRQHVERRLKAGTDKYFGEAIEAHVVFSREADHYRADCSIHVGHGIQAFGHPNADELKDCLDAALDRMEKRLRRYKRRLRDHHDRKSARVSEVQAGQSYVIEAEDEPEVEPSVTTTVAPPTIVDETPTEIHSLEMAEAVMRLELADLPILFFRNQGSGRFNVVYRRGDGRIGWIAPDAIEPLAGGAGR